MSELPYDNISPWVETPPDLCAPLTGDVRTDVVVIGGGYTGLSTALELRADGIDVVLLEQDFAGSGASGRNAGHLTPTIGKDLPTLLRMFGRERAEALVRFADDAVDHTEGIIERIGADCDYVASGNVLAGVHPKQEGRLRKAAQTAAELGGHVRFLSGEQMRERGLPRAFLFGVLEERGGTLHPGKYVMALRDAALAAGVRLFERTHVVQLEDGKPVRVRTDRGRLTADRAVIATNAYTPALGWKTRSLAPLRVSLFETEPLDPGQLAVLGWRNREGVYTAHEILESYRLTVRGTIVGGSKMVRYAWGNALPNGYDPDAFRFIERGFNDRFPDLGKVKIATFWGGWIGLTLDFLPLIGTAGAHANVHYGLGYAGHGVAQATFMGSLLAERVQGRAHPSEAALARKERAWPPEPLRWLGAKLLNGTLAALDARTDRQIREMERNASMSDAAAGQPGALGRSRSS